MQLLYSQDNFRTIEDKLTVYKNTRQCCRTSTPAVGLFDSHKCTISQNSGLKGLELLQNLMNMKYFPKLGSNTVKYFLFVGIQFSLFSWMALPTNLRSHE